MKSRERGQKFGKELHQIAATRQHRHCLVLCGNASWGYRTAWELCSSYSPESILLVTNGEHIPDNRNAINTLTIARAHKVLGREFDVVVYDCFSGFDADAVGILGGTIKSGGQLILIAPAITKWPEYDDPQYARIIAFGDSNPESSHYIRRLVNIISKSPNCILIQEHCDFPRVSEDKPLKPAGPRNFSDQHAAIDAVRKVVTGQRRRPVVLLSDRGRGKSAALGIAAGQLLNGTLSRIGVTGLNRQSADCVFKHARLQGAHGDDSICFFAADKLIETKADIDLLLVDEAASIPVSMLKKLLEIYPRIAFASTVHGYEGTGRGFILRFKEILDNHTRGWKSCTLNAPIRWAPDDPLERFLFDALILDAEPEKSSTKIVSTGALEFNLVTQSDMVDNEKLTRRFFGLLTQAHYRTRPFDLRHILDAGNLRIFTISQNQVILAVAVVAIEGGFDDKIARKIWANQSRPKGHLLPELLCAQLGLIDAAQLLTARIMRIVVNPSIQRRGIGKRFLANIADFFQGKADMLGTTFGASLPVLNFWLDSAYIPVRIGQSLSHNTGTHSCTLIKAISVEGNSLVSQAVEKFSGNLNYLLHSSLSSVDPALLPPIYRSLGNHKVIPKFTEMEMTDLTGFAFANLSMENISATLIPLAEFALKSGLLDNSEQKKRLLVERVLQGKSWSTCTALPPPTGKKQGIIVMREIVQTIVTALYPDQVAKIIETFEIKTGGIPIDS